MISDSHLLAWPGSQATQHGARPREEVCFANATSSSDIRDGDECLVCPTHSDGSSLEDNRRWNRWRGRRKDSPKTHHASQSVGLVDGPAMSSCHESRRVLCQPSSFMDSNEPPAVDAAGHPDVVANEQLDMGAAVNCCETEVPEEAGAAEVRLCALPARPFGLKTERVTERRSSSRDQPLRSFSVPRSVRTTQQQRSPSEPLYPGVPRVRSPTAPLIPFIPVSRESSRRWGDSEDTGESIDSPRTLRKWRSQPRKVEVPWLESHTGDDAPEPFLADVGGPSFDEEENEACALDGDGSDLHRVPPTISFPIGLEAAISGSCWPFATTPCDAFVAGQIFDPASQTAVPSWVEETNNTSVLQDMEPGPPEEVQPSLQIQREQLRELDQKHCKLRTGTSIERATVSGCEGPDSERNDGWHPVEKTQPTTGNTVEVTLETAACTSPIATPRGNGAIFVGQFGYSAKAFCGVFSELGTEVEPEENDRILEEPCLVQLKPTCIGAVDSLEEPWVLRGISAKSDAVTDLDEASVTQSHPEGLVVVRHTGVLKGSRRIINLKQHERLVGASFGCKGDMDTVGLDFDFADGWWMRLEHRGALGKRASGRVSSRQRW